MKRKKNSLILSALFSGCILTSCANEDTLSTIDVNDMDQDREIFMSKLKSDAVELSAKDAGAVTKLFLNGSATRSFSDKTIRNILPVDGSDSNVAFYAVNFKEGGYVIISATTKYFPILAEVEKGEYSDNMPETGQQVILEQLKENVRLARAGKHDFKCQSFWNKYIESDSPSAKTRTSSDYMEEYNNWYNSQAYGDYRIRKLVNCKNILPDNIYADYVAAAQSEDLWEGTEYSWENTAYVVERTTESVTNIGPLLKTNWDQGGTFSADGIDVGCVTVAVGQIMRHFEYPTTFAWSNMPDSKGNTVLQAFLARLKSEIGIGSNGATIDDAQRVLKSYGYTVTKKDHDVSAVLRHLRTYRTPVYARGAKGFLKSGHAWVVDGTYYYQNNVTYTLFRLADTAYPDFKYEEAENADRWTEQSHVNTYHMNWGWGGRHDGWFNDNNISINASDGVRNYYYERKELYINKP